MRKQQLSRNKQIGERGVGVAAVAVRGEEGDVAARGSVELRAVAEEGVEEGHAVAAGFDVNIKTAVGKRFLLTNCLGSTSIIDVKLKIQEAEGIPPDQQRLVFNGKMLKDNFCLSHYNITKLCLIEVVLKLRGC